MLNEVCNFYILIYSVIKKYKEYKGSYLYYEKEKKHIMYMYIRLETKVQNR